MAKAHTKSAFNSVSHSEDKPKACYALSLSVENIRCFGPKQTLDLSDGKGRPARWTIILGENGTGKTTLLQAMVVHELVESKSLQRVSIQNQSIRVDKEPRLVEIFWREPPGSTAIDPLGLQRNILSEVAPRCELQWGLFSDIKSPETPSAGTASWRITELFTILEPPDLLGFYAYGAGRRLGLGSLTSNRSDDPVGTLFDEHATLRNAEEWLLRLDYAASKKSDIQAEQKKRLEQVKELLVSILPEVEGIRFTTPGGPNPTPRVEFQTFSGWVPMRRLGYGYQTLIAWVTDFASRMVERYPDSSDPLKEPAIVVVDEIDLHLHPAWQRKLIGFLSDRFPNTQFIATAHSPLVVQAAENANLAVLKRVGDHVEIINDVDEIRGWRVDQILTSDLFGLKSARPPEVETLFARKQTLLEKAKLSAVEKAELAEVQEKIDRLPVGDTACSAKEMETIRQAIELLTSPK